MTASRSAGGEPRRQAAAATLVALLLTVAASIWPAAVAPPAVGVEAGEHLFSAERARHHLREITREPRPAGSPAHAAAREYLLEALAELGLEIGTQQTTAVSDLRGRRAAHVENVVARLPGTASTGAVLLASHYDSAPHSFGATDAGHGVVAILETVRALRAGPPLRNDLIVLFTDAEEVGLLGASAFVAEHPLASEAAIVLNAEGRGNEGPVFVIRTSPEGGELIRAAAGSVVGAAANSLTAAVLQYIPNDTDLSVFLRAGIAGMDMANAHGLTHYHTPLDDFERASARTLQHHGGYLLGLSRHFADRDLTDLAAPDLVYFTLPVIRMVRYPAGWALPLALLAGVFGSAVVAAGVLRRRLRGNGMALGLAVMVGTLVVLPAASFGAWSALRAILPDTSSVHAFGYDRLWYLIFLVSAGVGVVLAAVGWLVRVATAAELLAAPLATWLALAIASAAVLPGGSYVFLWPALGAGCTMAVLLARARGDGVGHAVLLTLCALPILLVVPQVIYMLEVVLTLDAVVVLTVVFTLLLTLLVPQLALVRTGLGRAAPAIFLAIAAVALLGGLARSGFDAERPRPTGVNYVSNPMRGEALWTSTDPVLTTWTRHFLGDAPERRTLPEWGIASERWVGLAPIVAVVAPDVEVVSIEASGEDRLLRLRIRPVAGGWQTVLSTVGGGVARDVMVDGRTLPVASGGPIVSLYGSPEQGFEVTFTVPDEVAAIRVRGIAPGLPEIPGAPHPAPAAQLMNADFTLIDRILPLGTAAAATRSVPGGE